VTRIRTDAIVIRHVKQGDSSRVVTLFTREAGKVAVMAKGARKPGSRFGAGMGLFARSQVGYRPRPGRDLVYLDTCELLESFDSLLPDVLGYAAAASCVELVDRLAPPGAASVEIYELLLSALRILTEVAPFPEGEGARAAALPVAFQAHVMATLGIAPELMVCVECGGDGLGDRVSLSARRGGVLCRQCRDAEGGRRLGAEAVSLLRGSILADLSFVVAAPRGPSEAAVLEARTALDGVLAYHHGRPSSFRARAFLDPLWRGTTPPRGFEE
jgi:DNA repair protein RecO (recombination protein O)